jgi:hypothetical protein
MIDRRHLVAAVVAAAFSASAIAAGADEANSNKQKQEPQAQSQQNKDKQSASAGGNTGASGKQGGSKQSSAGQQAPANAPMIVLVPVTVASSSSFGNGCWARLYEDENFQGNQLSLIGPQDMSNMRTAFGTDWSGDFESIQVGPRATVTVYDNENYGQKAATFKPNQKVPELSNRLGFFEQIRSLKINCAGGQRSAQQGTSQSGASSGSSTSGSGSSPGSSK